MAYKYNKTIMNGAEKLIDGIENIEMFLGDDDAWNFHDSEIYSIHYDRDTKTFTVTVDLIGCDFSKLEDFDYESTVLLDLHFEGCIDIHMPNVDFMCPYIYEIEISKSHKMIECWFNGYPIRVTSKRLRVDKPRVIKITNIK